MAVRGLCRCIGGELLGDGQGAAVVALSRGPVLGVRGDQPEAVVRPRQLVPHVGEVWVLRGQGLEQVRGGLELALGVPQSPRSEEHRTEVAAALAQARYPFHGGGLGRECLGVPLGGAEPFLGRRISPGLG